jgi:hypothetical protein
MVASGGLGDCPDFGRWSTALREERSDLHMMMIACGIKAFRCFPRQRTSSLCSSDDIEGASPFQHLQTVFLAVGDGRVLGSQLGLPMVLGRSADHLFAIADRMADTIDIYSFRFSDR